MKWWSPFSGKEPSPELLLAEQELEKTIRNRSKVEKLASDMQRLHRENNFAVRLDQAFHLDGNGK